MISHHTHFYPPARIEGVFCSCSKWAASASSDSGGPSQTDSTRSSSRSSRTSPSSGTRPPSQTYCRSPLGSGARSA